LSDLTGRYLPAGKTASFEAGTSTLIPLVDGEQYFGEVRREIGRTRGAGDVIYMLGWRFEANFRFSTDPNDVSELGTVLALKAAAGVDVRIIMSAKWQILWLLEHNTDADLRAGANYAFNVQIDRFGPKGNLLHAEILRNIKVGRNAPLNARVLLDHTGELLGIHHQKMVVVQRDGSAVGFLGGLDFLADRLDTTRHDEALPRKTPTRPNENIDYYWHDAGARIEGPAVHRLFWAFATRWMYCATEMTDRSFTLKDGQRIASLNPRIEQTAPQAKPQKAPLATGSKALPGVFIAMNFPERDVRGSNPAAHDPHGLFAKPPLHTTGDLYKKAISSARKYIYVEDQYFSAKLLEPVLRAAKDRGVKIIVVMGGFDDDAGKAVSPQVTNVFLKELGDKIALRHLKSTIVHSKLLIVDDEFVAIGSTNFADRSLAETEDQPSPQDEPLRQALKAVSQGWGTDSEISVAAVDDRTDDWNVAMRLRVLLWAEHLRVDPTDRAIWRELSDLGTALSIFDPAWGKSVTFQHPNSRLVRVTITR
jgi:hypothetical protein